MTPEEALLAVNEVFVEVLENDSILLTPQTSAEDVKEWDSLNHIQLVVAIEKRFKIRFLSSEIMKWKNVGDMCAAIAKASTK